MVRKHVTYSSEVVTHTVGMNQLDWADGLEEEFEHPLAEGRTSCGNACVMKFEEGTRQISLMCPTQMFGTKAEALAQEGVCTSAQQLACKGIRGYIDFAVAEEERSYYDERAYLEGNTTVQQALITDEFATDPDIDNGLYPID